MSRTHTCTAQSGLGSCHGQKVEINYILRKSLKPFTSRGRRSLPNWTVATPWTQIGSLSSAHPSPATFTKRMWNMSVQHLHVFCNNQICTFVLHMRSPPTAIEQNMFSVKPTNFLRVIEPCSPSIALCENWLYWFVPPQTLCINFKCSHDWYTYMYIMLTRRLWIFIYVPNVTWTTYILALISSDNTHCVIHMSHTTP